MFVNVQITVSDDETAAYICVGTPGVNKEYTVESLVALAKDAGVIHGVNTEILKAILVKKLLIKQLNLRRHHQQLMAKTDGMNFYLILR